MTVTKNTEMQNRKSEPSKDVEMTRDLPVYSPATDIFEKNDSILVVCDMPGVDEKHVDITLEDDVLTLTGSQDIQEPSDSESVYRGYRPGVFRRSFTVATAIDHEKIKARLNNGVLQVVLPKAVNTQPKKIPVEVGT